MFVYGTLKAGRSNAGALRGADFLGRCRYRRPQTCGLGLLPRSGFGPDLKAPQRSVLGEVYRITLANVGGVDMIEGHPDYYERTKVTTPWKGAWAYYLPSEYLNAREPVEEVDGVQVWRPSDEEVPVCPRLPT